MLHKFIVNILVVKDGIATKSELKPSNSKIDSETLISNLVLFNQHVKFCMTSFSTYFMVTKTTTTDLDTKKEIQALEIIAAMIVKNDVLMTKIIERALIHYICVIPDLRRLNIGTALMKNVLTRDEYHNKEIMAVISLPQRYRSKDDYETMVSFYYI